MSSSKAQQEATKKYEDEHYDKILLRLPKGYKALIASTFNPKGSLNGYLRELVDADLEKRGLISPKNMD